MLATLEQVKTSVIDATLNGHTLYVRTRTRPDKTYVFYICIKKASRITLPIEGTLFACRLTPKLFDIMNEKLGEMIWADKITAQKAIILIDALWNERLEEYTYEASGHAKSNTQESIEERRRSRHQRI